MKIWHKGHRTLDYFECNRGHKGSGDNIVFWFPLLRCEIFLPFTSIHVSSFISTLTFVPCVKLMNYDFVVLNGWKFCLMSAVERQSFCCGSIYCLSSSPKADLTGSLSSDCRSMLGEQGPCVGETSVVYTTMVRPLQSLVGNWETETGAVSAIPNLWNSFYPLKLIQTWMNPQQFKVHK